MQTCATWSQLRSSLIYALTAADALKASVSDLLPIFVDQRITGDAKVGIFSRPVRAILGLCHSEVEHFLFYARGHDDSADGQCRGCCRRPPATIAFFVELGLELEGKTTVEGPWVNRSSQCAEVHIPVCRCSECDGEHHFLVESTCLTMLASVGIGAMSVPETRAFLWRWARYELPSVRHCENGAWFNVGC